MPSPKAQTNQGAFFFEYYNMQNIKGNKSMTGSEDDFVSKYFLVFLKEDLK